VFFVGRVPRVGKALRMQGFGRIVDELNKAQAHMKAAEYSEASMVLKKLWDVSFSTLHFK
jgi:hypothetical protein